MEQYCYILIFMLPHISTTDGFNLNYGNSLKFNDLGKHDVNYAQQSQFPFPIPHVDSEHVSFTAPALNANVTQKRQKVWVVTRRLPFSVHVDHNDGSLFKNDYEDAPHYAKWLSNADPTIECFNVGDPALNHTDPRILAACEVWLRGHESVPVFVPSQHADKYNEDVLLPLFNYRLPPLGTGYNINQNDWKAYVNLCDLFCDTLCRYVSPRDLVLIFDTSLMLLPMKLRRRMPNISVAYVLNEVFPSSEVFRILPKRVPLLRGILASDLVALSAFQYKRHCLTSAGRLLGLRCANNFVTLPPCTALFNSLASFTCRVASLPRGTDNSNLLNMSAADIISERNMVMNLRHRLGGRKVILSICETKFTAGIGLQLLAFQRFLQDHPEWLGRCVFLLILDVSQHSLAIPDQVNSNSIKIDGNNIPHASSASSNSTKKDTVHNFGIGAHSNVDSDIFKQTTQLVSSINAAFGQLDALPVHCLLRTLSPIERSRLCAAADVLLIGALREAFSPLSHLFVAAQSILHGSLTEETSTANPTLHAGVQVPTDPSSSFDSGSMKPPVQMTSTSIEWMPPPPSLLPPEATSAPSPAPGVSDAAPATVSSPPSALFSCSNPQRLVGEKGCLILSEFSGSSLALASSAFIANPWDVSAVAGSISSALTITPFEKETRMQFAFDYVTKFDANRWAQELLSEVRSAVSVNNSAFAESSANVPPPINELQVTSTFMRSKVRIIILGFQNCLWNGDVCDLRGERVGNRNAASQQGEIFWLHAGDSQSEESGLDSEDNHGEESSSNIDSEDAFGNQEDDNDDDLSDDETFHNPYRMTATVPSQSGVDSYARHSSRRRKDLKPLQYRDLLQEDEDIEGVQWWKAVGRGDIVICDDDDSDRSSTPPPSDEDEEETASPARAGGDYLSNEMETGDDEYFPNDTTEEDPLFEQRQQAVRINTTHPQRPAASVPPASSRPSASFLAPTASSSSRQRTSQTSSAAKRRSRVNVPAASALSPLTSKKKLSSMSSAPSRRSKVFHTASPVRRSFFKHSQTTEKRNSACDTLINPHVDPDTLRAVESLAGDFKTCVIIVSSSPRSLLEKVFGHIPQITLIAENGHEISPPVPSPACAANETDNHNIPSSTSTVISKRFWLRDSTSSSNEIASWKEPVRTIFRHFAVSTPGSRIVETRTSIAWHFSPALRTFAALQAKELLVNLWAGQMTSVTDVAIGTHSIEVRAGGNSKASSLANLLDCIPILTGNSYPLSHQQSINSATLQNSSQRFNSIYNTSTCTTPNIVNNNKNPSNNSIENPNNSAIMLPFMKEDDVFILCAANLLSRDDDVFSSISSWYKSKIHASLSSVNIDSAVAPPSLDPLSSRQQQASTSCQSTPSIPLGGLLNSAVSENALRASRECLAPSAQPFVLCSVGRASSRASCMAMDSSTIRKLVRMMARSLKVENSVDVARTGGVFGGARLSDLLQCTIGGLSNRKLIANNEDDD